jgi:hypothetical protein
MNMLARISAAPVLERAPDAASARLLDLRPHLHASATSHLASPSLGSEEAAALALLDREERVLILLSRGGSRLAALAGSWAAAAESRLPALSAEAAEAQARQSRLAALRRYAILYRLDRSGLAFEEDERLDRAGYSEAQAEAVRFLVEQLDRSWSRPRGRWGKSLAFAALAIAGTFGLYRWLEQAVDDRLLSLLLAIVIATAIASFLSVTAHPAGAARTR